jgi:hypothetical protein
VSQVQEIFTRLLRLPAPPPERPSEAGVGDWRGPTLPAVTDSNHGPAAANIHNFVPITNNITMYIFMRMIRRMVGSSIASLNPYRLCSAPLRTVPDFLIIGTQRGGTTSLYNCLVQHPQIRRASIKEVHYFDLNYGKSLLWYRSHFPLSSLVGENTKILTGEASPYYLFHPLVPERVHRLLPNVKLIILLRNPVDRAISHYHHIVRLGWEPLSLEEAIAREPLRLAGESDKIRENPNYASANHRHYSYLARGLYYDQILNWTRHFARERILILNSEEFFESPGPALRSVYEFLGLDDFGGPRHRRDNTGRYPKIHEATRRKIHEIFEYPNSVLFDYLGIDYGWEH